MHEGWKAHLRTPGRYCWVLVKWLLLGALLGTLGGLVGGVFYLCIVKLTEVRLAHRYVVLLLPLGAIIIGQIYSHTRKKGNIDNVLRAVTTSEHVPWRTGPIIFFSTLLTQLLGGSNGKVGAALQLGGVLGDSLGKLFRLPEHDRHTLVMTGMSALFSAIFGAPTAAALFALEVVGTGVLYHAALIPSVVAAFCAKAVARKMGATLPDFVHLPAAGFSLPLVLKLLLMALLLALISIAFITLLHKIEDGAFSGKKHPMLQAVVWAAVVAAVPLLLGNMDYNGAGLDIAVRMVNEGSAPWYAFALKFVLTLISIQAGFKGGEVAPTLFIGAAFGCAFADLWGIDATLCAALGMIGLLCANINCPITCILLSVELFGGENILYFALVCAVTFMLSGNYSVYHDQIIVYSKTSPEYIHRRANT